MHIRLFVVIALFHTVGSAAEFVLSRPTVTNPNREIGDDSLQIHYDKIWEMYSEAIANISNKIEEELKDQTEQATEAGNLDLAVFWRDLDDAFAHSGKVKWNSFELERTWRARFQDTAFPKTILPLLQAAQEGFDSAISEMASAYIDLEKKLTQAGMLDAAIALRKEAQDILGKTRQESTPPKLKSHGKVGGEINLFPLVQLAGKGTLGDWKRNGQAVICSGKKEVKTLINFEPPAEYEFGVVFKVIRGGELVQASSAPGQKFQWLLRMYPKASPVGRFAMLRSKYAGASATWPVNLSLTHHSVVRVGREGITAIFDGKAVASIPAELVPESDCSAAWDHGNKLSIGSWNSDVIFSRIYLRPF